MEEESSQNNKRRRISTSSDDDSDYAQQPEHNYHSDDESPPPPTSYQEKQRQHSSWAFLPPEIFPGILTFLDVPTLIEKKQVNRTWREHCTNTINKKRTPATAKVFQTNQELCYAVVNYTLVKKNPEYAEELAQTYGYPIGKWDVSNVDDFSCVFEGCAEFNEDINDWDVSNAKEMYRMFSLTGKFNKPLSNWNTSKVEDMRSMFDYAESFNQDLSNFDTSQVLAMESMFLRATKFNKDISNWDTSQVRDMGLNMFVYATSFHRGYAPASLDPYRIFYPQLDRSDDEL